MEDRAHSLLRLLTSTEVPATEPPSGEIADNMRFRTLAPFIRLLPRANGDFVLIIPIQLSSRCEGRSQADCLR
jgi:hypothetical protein